LLFVIALYILLEQGCEYALGLVELATSLDYLSSAVACQSVIQISAVAFSFSVVIDYSPIPVPIPYILRHIYTQSNSVLLLIA